MICDWMDAGTRRATSLRCVAYRETQKSLAEGIVCPPQGIKYGVGGLDAAFIRCLRGVFMRCDAMRCDAMRKIRAILLIY